MRMVNSNQANILPTPRSQCGEPRLDDITFKKKGIPTYYTSIVY